MKRIVALLAIMCCGMLSASASALCARLPSKTTSATGISASPPGSTSVLCTFFSRPISPWQSSDIFGTAPANQMNKNSSGSALLSGKCPACREGNVFKYPVSRISHFAEMNHECPVCHSSFEREPGFYYGAMFITYAFNAALVIAAGLVISTL